LDIAEDLAEDFILYRSAGGREGESWREGGMQGSFLSLAAPMVMLVDENES
jgi:hypothetical protein